MSLMRSLLLLVALTSPLFASSSEESGDELMSEAYKKKHKKYFEISTHPLNILKGELIGKFAFGIGEFFTTGLEMGYIRFSERGFRINGYDYTWVQDFVSVDDSSPLLQLGLGYKKEHYSLDFSVEDDAIDGRKSGNWQFRYLKALAGYRWVLDTGFFLALSAGVISGNSSGNAPQYTNLYGDPETLENRLITQKKTAEFKIGYGF